MEFGELTTNPFSGDIDPNRAKRRPFIKALKFLMLVAVCLGITVIISSHSRGWLAQHLLADFDTLDSETKRTRLTQLSGLGTPGIDPLVNALADRDIQVARTAFELLNELQSHWESLDHSQRRRRQQTLVRALHGIAVQLPDDRTGWGTRLLQQTIAATADRTDDSSRRLYRSATEVVDMLAISERSGPSVLSDQPLEASVSRPITIRPRPLATTNNDQLRPEVDGPSKKTAAADQRDRSTDSASQTVGGDTRVYPSVYRSGGNAKLQPAGKTNVVLQQVGDRQETSYQAKSLTPVAHVVDSPMESLDDESVMRWLGSPHTAMREQAKAELQSRGFNPSDITIASRLSAGDIPSRLAMIDSIARSDQIDPRPWLLMSLKDESRQVKLRAISVLATMQDAYVNQRLQMRLAEEQDAAVVDQIRQVLARK